jgi:hypothetical protein
MLPMTEMQQLVELAIAKEFRRQNEKMMRLEQTGFQTAALANAALEAMRPYLSDEAKRTLAK